MIGRKRKKTDGEFERGISREDDVARKRQGSSKDVLRTYNPTKCSFQLKSIWLDMACVFYRL